MRPRSVAKVKSYLGSWPVPPWIDVFDGVVGDESRRVKRLLMRAHARLGGAGPDRRPCRRPYWRPCRRRDRRPVRTLFLAGADVTREVPTEPSIHRRCRTTPSRHSDNAPCRLFSGSATRLLACRNSHTLVPTACRGAAPQPMRPPRGSSSRRELSARKARSSSAMHSSCAQPSLCSETL